MKIILLFLLLLIPSLIKAEAVDYDWLNEESLKIEKITLNKISEYDRIIDGKYYNAQGFAVTPTHFVFSLVSGDSEKTQIFFINRITLKTDKIISDHYLGHANDFAYNSKTKQLVLPYILNNKSYVAYFDAVNLSFIKSEPTEVITFALGYNSSDDKYYYRINSSTYTVDSNFQNIKELFENTDYGNMHLVKQGMSINDNKLYFSLFEYGNEINYQNGRYSSKRVNDCLIAISDAKGNYLKSYHIPFGDNKIEIESIDFDDNGQMYLLYNNMDSMLAIYKMNYEEENININFKIKKNNLKDNEYKFKLMDNDKLIAEKSNIGNTVTFENIVVSDTGTKTFKIVDSDNNKEYTAKIHVKADTFNKKLLLSDISYDNKNELIIDKNINNIHVFISIISITFSITILLSFKLVINKRKTRY